MPALQQFLKAELPRRGWSMEYFARHAHLSLSTTYLIVRDGKDNVRRETFEHIAAALGMTPAELMVAIGKGAEDDNPRRAVLHALLRQVADEDLPVFERLTRPFVAQPVPSASIAAPAGASRRHRGASPQLAATQTNDSNNVVEDRLPSSNSILDDLRHATRGLIEGIPAFLLLQPVLEA